MSNVTSRAVKLFVAGLLAVLGTLGLGGMATASPVVAAPAAIAQANCGDTSGFDKAALSSLPKEASDTVDLIKKGGPFPYPGKDGSVFTNREGVLPKCDSGYYHEYTVPTPGSPDRGARRIITGEGGEYFYTADHYASFVLVDINS